MNIKTKVETMKLIKGDCLEEMCWLEPNSVDTILTDPPYGLKFMGKEWDAFTDNEAFQEWTRQWATEALRVAKPGAMMLCFGGTRTFHRIACGIEDAGWEIRDTMMWIYGSGFPKSYNISKGIDKKAGVEREKIPNPLVKQQTGQDAGKGLEGERNQNLFITIPATDQAKLWDGWGTALKPAFEPIIVAMKSRDGTFVENALKWGVAGLNIDGGRVPTEDKVTINTWDNGAKPFGDGAGNPYSGREETQGRWPANIVHDGSEEVEEGFPDSKSCNSPSKATPKSKYRPNQGEYQPQGKIYPGDTGSAARFFYCAKASKKERNAGIEQNNHPTVKPLSLMEYLVKLTSTPTGGLVLDPFMGSGTTGMACKKIGRDFIGIELDEHYFEIAEKRIANVGDGI